MSDETNALEALKNAWSGAASTSGTASRFGAEVVSGIPTDAPPGGWRLDDMHQIVLAQANAVMALRGLIEELRRRYDPGTTTPDEPLV